MIIDDEGIDARREEKTGADRSADTSGHSGGAEKTVMRDSTRVGRPIIATRIIDALVAFERVASSAVGREARVTEHRTPGTEMANRRNEPNVNLGKICGHDRLSAAIFLRGSATNEPSPARMAVKPRWEPYGERANEPRPARMAGDRPSVAWGGQRTNPRRSRSNTGRWGGGTEQTNPTQRSVGRAPEIIERPTRGAGCFFFEEGLTRTGREMGRLGADDRAMRRGQPTGDPDR